MLPASFNERLDQMMGLKIGEIATEMRQAFARDSAEAARRGSINLSSTHGLYQRSRLRQIEMRVRAVVEAQKRLISILHVPYSEKLATDLKSRVELYAPVDWCEKLLESDSGVADEQLKAKFREEILQVRSNALSKAFIEIDLLTDELSTQLVEQTQSEAKELDQKFKILWSPDQARKDFDDWMTKLTPDEGQIAVIFADLDNFKALNDKYTEPRIDQAFLPEAMSLVESAVRLRGGAYKHGGDEYVLILPNHNATEGMNFADKIRRAFEQRTFMIGNDSINITISLGVAIWPNHGSNYDEMLTAASSAKQTAKATRNCVALAQVGNTDALPLPKSGLSPVGQKLAKFLNEKSLAAEDADPMIGPEPLRAQLRITEDELAIAADELRARGWILIEPDGSKVGFRYLWPLPLLFFATDPLLKGWDSQQDAKTVAITAVEMGDDSLRLPEIGGKLDWEPRCLNPAASWLERKAYAKFSTAMGTSPYRYTTMFVTPSTRRLASEK